MRSGKGRKERIVYAANGARAAVEAWIEVRGMWEGALLTPVAKGGRHAAAQHDRSGCHAAPALPRRSRRSCAA